MAHIITIAHQKGGVGKTTLALNLASCLQTNDLTVKLIDADPQGSLNNLIGLASEFSILPLPKSLDNMAKIEANVIFIDTPPYLSNLLPTIFLRSDFVLIPTKAGFFDVAAIKGTIALVKQAQQTKTKLKAGIVLNMVKPRTSLTDEVKELLLAYEIPLLKTQISDRVSYTRSAVLGSIFKTDDERAKTEITELTDEIITSLL